MHGVCTLDIGYNFQIIFLVGIKICPFIGVRLVDRILLFFQHVKNVY
jgi:hypothetical protein